MTLRLPETQDVVPAVRPVSAPIASPPSRVAPWRVRDKGRDGLEAGARAGVDGGDVEVVPDRWRWAAVAAGVVAFALIVACAATRAPWWDEGLYADVAWSLVRRGTFGSPLMGANGAFGFGDVPRMDVRTYWTTPLWPVVLAGWLRVVGEGLLAARLLPVALTAGMVAGWYALVRRVTGREAPALLAIGLVALNSNVIFSATNVRPDALAALLTVLAALAYLRWRTTHLVRACAVASALCAAAMLSHPLALVQALPIAGIALVRDWRVLRAKHVLAVLLAGALVFLPWALYIAADPETFRAQWSVNSASAEGSRLAGLTNPLGALAADFGRRWWYNYYVLPTGLSRLVVVELLGFVAVLVLAIVPGVRPRHAGGGTLLALALGSVVALAILDGSTYRSYFLHVAPAVAALGALLVHALWASGAAWRRGLAVLLVGAIVGPGAAGAAHRVRTDPYHRDFVPVAEALRAAAARGDRVVAGSEFAFVLGFDTPALRDDMTLREPAALYVQSDFYRTFTDGLPVQQRLAREWRLVLDNGRYRLYAPATPTAPTAPAPTAPGPATPVPSVR